MRFQTGFNFSKKASGELAVSHNVVVEPVVEPNEKTLNDVRVISEEESTDLPFTAEKSKRPTKRKPTDRHYVSTHFPRDPNCEVCKLTKTTRASCRNRPDARGDRIHLNESRLQHRYAVVMQDLSSYWIQRYRTRNTAQETMKRMQKFVPPDQKPVIIILIIPWSLSVLVKTLVGITTSQPHTDQTPM